jgi:hypothetical protein
MVVFEYRMMFARSRRRVLPHVLKLIVKMIVQCKSSSRYVNLVMLLLLPIDRQRYIVSTS